MSDHEYTRPDETTEIRHRLEHDLCGPLITARGFLEEITGVRAELGQWMTDNRESLSNIDGDAMERLLAEELDVCVDYLEKALNQLDTRILVLVKTLSASDSDTDQE